MNLQQHVFENWQLIGIVSIYIAILFALAWYGDRHANRLTARQRPWIYAFSLAVYCSSWSFLGANGQSVDRPYQALPIFIAPVLLCLVAWPLVQRMIRVSHRLRLTSIADLLAARYGKSQCIASAVTLVALIGTLPYIALQLRAMVATINPLLHPPAVSKGSIALLITGLLVVFTTLFGIRSVNVTERHPGLMLAIAFESLLKLSALLVIALCVVFTLYDGPFDLWQQLEQADLAQHYQKLPPLSIWFGSLVVIGMAFLCLPRQFHVTVVECRNIEETRPARWLFPAYLLIFALLTLPIGMAGRLLLAGQASTDAYMLTLPDLAGNKLLLLLSFLGTISAGSAMVIISAVALSTMLSNELVLPLLIRFARVQTTAMSDHFGRYLLLTRKLLVLVILLLALLVDSVAPAHSLTLLGSVAMGAIAQLAPPLFAAFFWRRANLYGVGAGLLLGTLSWLMTVAWPQLFSGTQWVAATASDQVTLFTLLSLLLNTTALVIGSLLGRNSIQEQIQASHFLERHNLPAATRALRVRGDIDIREMETLAARFVGTQRARESFAHLSRSLAFAPQAHDRTTPVILTHTERLLGSVMGAASARLVLGTALQGRDIDLDSVVRLIEDISSERAQFSRTLLQSAIENTSEGISVIDEELRLVAWNPRYLELFNYPLSMIHIGVPIEQLIRYNIQRGFNGPGDLESLVQQRMTQIRRRIPHQSERRHPDGQVIRIQGTPMPGGGFVMTFSDITRFREAEQVLKDANTELERRVQQRTEQLSQLNRELQLAKRKAEQASHNKSGYLNAVSHDLMQPLEAARLFANALAQKPELDEASHNTLRQLDQSLKAANDLLTDLADVARIDSGRIVPQWQTVYLYDLLNHLYQDFVPIAAHQQISLKVHCRHAWTRSDPHLLRRVVQNLLANALQHAGQGRVLLCCRSTRDGWRLEVRDNGQGIPEEKVQDIFEPFSRLGNSNYSKGLGLGLSIAKGLSSHLGHQLGVRSRPGHGSCFYVVVKRSQPAKVKTTPLDRAIPQPTAPFAGLTVLCVDNDQQVLAGMTELLSGWGCHVWTAASGLEAETLLQSKNQLPTILLVDYQLDHGENGLDVIADLRHACAEMVPAILITANRDPHIAQQAELQHCGFLRKLIKPARLRALMRQLIYSNNDERPSVSN